MSRIDDDDPKQPQISIELTEGEEGSNPPAQSEDGGTRVDMGDDLLERTAVLMMPGTQHKPPREQTSPSNHHLVPDAAPLSEGPIALDQIPDQMQSARILMGEGILEDAKRILRRILLADAKRFEARKMLEEIHEIELKQIFGESDTPRRRFIRNDTPTEIEVSADVVMRSLDHDLKLGIFGLDGGESGLSAPSGAHQTREPQLSLFKDRAALDAFGAQMDREFASSPATQRIDLGVAFCEMGLPDLAARHFQAAVGSLLLLQQEGHSTGPVVAATGLLAYALILAGRAFEATIALQPLLNDVDIEKIQKLDLIYLMGRAFEAMSKFGDARQWYSQAAELEPHYRDTDERLRKVAAR